MKNLLGVMQGRLLPKYRGRYQAHPVDYWQDEFIKASELKLDCIEFILDFNDAVHNPLLSYKGQEEIKKLTAQTGVKVVSVCADYFMEAPLHSKNEHVSRKSTEILQQLFESATELGIRNIVIPCVDQSSIQNEKERTRFQEVLSYLVVEAEQRKVNLALETDLEPSQFVRLLDKINSSYVTVNYDIGNSASLGYDFTEELNAYGEKISDIHLKDRVLGGGPVKLGSGNADIRKFFKLLQKFDFKGPLIMQAYRDDEGIAAFKEQLDWIRPYLEDL
jgi:L-ribulose-5-phosphate 3-epimerase